MKERYTKVGSSRRIIIRENERTEISIGEAGGSTSDGEHFEAGPIEAAIPEAPDGEVLEETVRMLTAQLSPPLTLRRLNAFSSLTGHTIEEPPRAWQERHLRIHARYENAGARAGIDLLAGGADSLATSESCISDAVSALALLTEREWPAPTLRLAPNVTAELWPWFAGGAGGIPIGQGAHPDYPYDGSGLAVEAREPSSAHWPNTFRPSYRYPAVFMPLHLRPLGSSTTFRSALRAVAFLEPLILDAGEGPEKSRLRCALLVTDGVSAGRLPVSLPVEEWAARVMRAAGEAIWFPVGSGSFGEEAELDLS